MLRPSLRRVFRSRWAALWWSGCILLTAWEVSSASDSVISAVKPAAAAAPAKDPWALDPR